MKRFLPLAFFVLIFPHIYAQTGLWSGKLEADAVSVRIVFHLDDDACTVDSPDQGVKGIPAKLERTLTGVKVNIPSLGARYEGAYLGRSIKGTFTQNGRSFPLSLTPGSPERKRPQTPVPPFPYSTEEVSFNNGDAVLKGTLTLPEGFDASTPTLIMITGSGLQNRDEEIFGHKPFAVLADALARNGIASLRYDDRGFGQSSGDLVYATAEDFKEDAAAGIELLRGRFAKVGALGHSEGGSIAFMLAAEKKVDFVVSLAGAIVSGKEILLSQNRLALLQAGYSEEVTSLYLSALEDIFEQIQEGLAPSLPESALPEELHKNLQAVAVQAGTTYMRHFLETDISKVLHKVACPVLALSGTKDVQVDCARNLAALRSGLPSEVGLAPEGSSALRRDDAYWQPSDKAPSGNLIIPIDGVNHLFQRCFSGAVSEYAEIEETISPEVLNVIIGWLKEN